MSKLRRQLSAGITSNVETRNLQDVKSKTGNVYESISIIAKRANQINISLKEELHNKLEEFASHTVCQTPRCWPRRSSWTIKSILESRRTSCSAKFADHVTSYIIVTGSGAYDRIVCPRITISRQYHCQ
jgi:hypothetical protein